MGCAKALLKLPDGRTFVEHAVSVARNVARKVLILGSLEELPAPLSGFPLLPDAEENAGPLGGLCTLLLHAHAQWALPIACDMPKLTPRVLRRLLAEAGESADAVAFACDGRPDTYHACCAAYHPRVLPTVRRALREDTTNLQRLLRSMRVVTLTPTAEETRLLANVNTPGDLTRVLHEA